METAGDGYGASLISSSEPGPGEPLSAEAERILAGVPDVIGEAEPEAGAAADGVTVTVEAPPVVLSSATVKLLLLAACKQVAKWRKFDRYAIGESEAGLLAGPYTELLNAVIDKLAPAFVRQFAVSLPGLGEAVALSAVIFGPVVMADLARQDESKAARMVEPGQSHVASAPAHHASVIWDEGAA